MNYVKSFTFVATVKNVIESVTVIENLRDAGLCKYTKNSSNQQIFNGFKLFKFES